MWKHWAIWAQQPSATFRIGQHATVHRKELQKGGKYGKYEQILVHVWYTLSKPLVLQSSKDHLLPGQYEETKSVQHLDRLSLFERGLGRLQPFGRATVPGSPDKRSSTIKDVNVSVCTYFSIYAHRWIYSSVSISLYIYNYIVLYILYVVINPKIIFWKGTPTHQHPRTTSALGEKHRRESLFRRVTRQPPNPKVRVSKWLMGFNHQLL